MTKTENKEHALEASFLTLAMSIASSAAISLGLSPDPNTGKSKMDVGIARFNIDLLDILQQKTKNNLSKEEQDFMQHVLADLKLKFVEVSRNDQTPKS